MFNNFSTTSTSTSAKSNTTSNMTNKTSRNGKVNLFANRPANPQPQQTKAPMQDSVRFYTSLGYSKLSGCVMANMHNGRILRKPTDEGTDSAFFSFRLVSETQGAIKAELLKSDGTVKPIDVAANLAEIFGVSVDKAPTEIHIQADFWNDEGCMDAELVDAELEDRTAKSAIITIPLCDLIDRGTKEFQGVDQQIFGARHAYVEFSSAVLTGNALDESLTKALFAPTAVKSNGLTAEQLRRRFKKATKKAESDAAKAVTPEEIPTLEAPAAVEAAKAAQAEVAESANIVVDEEKEALRRENAELKAEVAGLKVELANTNAKLDQILAMMTANAATPAPAAAPQVEETPAPEPTPEPTPEPEVAKEPVVEEPAPVVATESAPEVISDAQVASVEILEEGAAFDWCDDDEEEEIDFDFDCD